MNYVELIYIHVSSNISVTVLGEGGGGFKIYIYTYLWGPRYPKWFSNLNIKSVKPQCLHRFDLI